MFLNLQAFEAGTTCLPLTPQSTLTASSIATLTRALGKLYPAGISSDAAHTYGVFWVGWACVFKTEIPFLADLGLGPQ